ncbi:MAG: hypothetical protein OXJ53_04420 [Gammaproteobacteria bacterium]|nr:hypothetical protein [Gammaproteobacteria bacterium]
MPTIQAQLPRTVRAAPEPLGWYIRPSFVDHRRIADAVAGRAVGLHGIVFDPAYEDRHSELRDLIVERNRDAVLDPRTQELATIGGFNKRLSELPWALDRPHRPDDFANMPARRIVESIARHVVEKGYTAVLAPTHYLESANSPWLDIDARNTEDLRRQLDVAGAGNVPIFYSLAVSSKSRFGCREPTCCPKGWKDMLDNPVRHSLVQRSGEIQRLTDVPQHLRAQRFMEETLRPATDAAVFAESLSFGAERLAKRMRDNRKSLERLRVGLGEFAERGPFISYSQIPRRRVMRG